MAEPFAAGLRNGLCTWSKSSVFDGQTDGIGDNAVGVSEGTEGDYPMAEMNGETRKDVSLLIVDDEEPIRKLLSSALGGVYNCVTTESAEEATKLLGAMSFNLVITDIRMPGASGLELCQLVNKTCPETVPLVVSGMT
ncbi:MAG: response regulator transcription factor, partial [Blastocatellia bacterium]